MAQIKVLLLEDELTLGEIIRESLDAKGFVVTHYSHVTGMMNNLNDLNPDIIVLDVMLSDADGFELAKHLRNMGLETPIIFLTSKSMPADVVKGFESGGNDYLKKPFSIEELAVRIRALTSINRTLFKPEMNYKSQFSIGKYQFLYPDGLLIFQGQQRTLTARESEILQMLLINRNVILTRDTILNLLWQNNDYFAGRSLDVFVTKLRKYLKGDPSISIANIRGQGYKLIF